jgi:hypothetical protein
MSTKPSQRRDSAATVPNQEISGLLVFAANDITLIVGRRGRLPSWVSSGAARIAIGQILYKH